MATVSFNIPDEHLQRFVNGMASHYGYRETIGGEDNPETKAEYGRRKIKTEWIARVKRQERLAAEAAIAAVEPIEVT